MKLRPRARNNGSVKPRQGSLRKRKTQPILSFNATSSDVQSSSQPTFSYKSIGPPFCPHTVGEVSKRGLYVYRSIQCITAMEAYFKKYSFEELRLCEQQWSNSLANGEPFLKKESTKRPKPQPPGSTIDLSRYKQVMFSLEPATFISLPMTETSDGRSYSRIFPKGRQLRGSSGPGDSKSKAQSNDLALASRKSTAQNSARKCPYALRSKVKSSC